jgi:hypothetical protein
MNALALITIDHADSELLTLFDRLAGNWREIALGLKMLFYLRQRPWLRPCAQAPRFYLC